MILGACVAPPDEPIVADDDVDPDECSEVPTALAMDWSSMRLGSAPRALDYVRQLRSAVDCPEIEPMLPPLEWDWYTPEDFHPEMAWAWPPGSTPSVTPVTSSPAIILTDWGGGPMASDAIFFGDTNGLFRKLTNIHSSAPTDAWSASPPSTGGLSGSAVAVSLDGTQVFAFDDAADLYCFNASDGTDCPGTWPNTGLAGSPSGNAPWFDWQSNHVIIVNSAGTMAAVDATDGTTTATQALGAATSGSPIMVGTEVFIGVNGGVVKRVAFDGTAFSGLQSTTALCSGGAECNFANALAASILNGELYAAVGGQVHILPTNPAATWARIGSPATIGNATQVTSSPSVHHVDPTSFLYVHHENANGGMLYKMQIPGGSFGTVRSTLMYNRSDPGRESSSPLVWDPVSWGLSDDMSEGVYVGGGGGVLERYGCMGSDVAPERIAVSTDYGDAIAGTPVMDFSGGQVVFGRDTGTLKGGLIQLEQGETWESCGGNANVASNCSGPRNCEFCGAETATANRHYRARDMDIKDPHFFVSTDAGCTDVTNKVCVSLFGTCNLACECGVNYLLQAGIRGDDQEYACSGSTCTLGAPGPDANGMLDLSIMTTFRTWNKANNAVNEVQISAGTDCATPFDPASCTAAPTAAFKVDATNSNGSGVVCLNTSWSAVSTSGQNNSSAYSPGMTFPTSTASENCFSTTAVQEMILSLGDVNLRMLNVRVGAEYSGTDEFTDGFFMGFLSEADAEATTVDLGGTIGIKKVSELLRGGVGNCSSGGTLGVKSADKDCLDGSGSCSGTDQVGWWFYLNIRGEGEGSNTPGVRKVTCNEP